MCHKVNCNLAYYVYFFRWNSNLFSTLLKMSLNMTMVNSAKFLTLVYYLRKGLTHTKNKQLENCRQHISSIPVTPFKSAKVLVTITTIIFV